MTSEFVIRSVKADRRKRLRQIDKYLEEEKEDTVNREIDNGDVFRWGNFFTTALVPRRNSKH